MRAHVRCAVSLLFMFLPVCYTQAQIMAPMKLTVGSGFGQIGVVATPNEECRGPAAVTPTSNGGLAILDNVNRKILLIGGEAIEEIPLPSDLIEPTDFVATSRGYLVVGAVGDVVVVDKSGKALARYNATYNPEAGAARLVALPNRQLALEDLSGKRALIDLTPAQTGDLVIPGFATAAAYTRKDSQAGQGGIVNHNFSGPLATISVTSPIPIMDIHALWASEADGAVVAVQENRQLPEEASFLRLVSFDGKGRATSEAYVGPEAFACDTRRPYARLTDGTIVSLAFGENNSLKIIIVSFAPLGMASPLALGQGADVSLISDRGDVFKALEHINVTPSVSAITLSQISRASILERARAALEFKWQLAAKNFSDPGVPNLCAPPARIWHRPPRLNSMLNQEVTGIPYRWGGYISTLDVFKTNLDEGRLAGDDCTCRNANCVDPRATGQDCSGFVSYAWQIGNYYTTVSLPLPTISMSVQWADITPGDIVNKAGSHVRLVEGISTGPNGRFLTVIESTTKESCGGVCRRSYPESELDVTGYKPLHRHNVTK